MRILKEMGFLDMHTIEIVSIINKNMKRSFEIFKRLNFRCKLVMAEQGKVYSHEGVGKSAGKNWVIRQVSCIN